MMKTLQEPITDEYDSESKPRILSSEELTWNLYRKLHGSLNRPILSMLVKGSQASRMDEHLTSISYQTL